MLTIVPATTASQRQDVKGVLWEYMLWVNAKVQEEVGISFDIQAALEHDLASQDFAPPGGCLLVAYDDEDPAGCVCMRTIGTGVAELKRMYVRPAHRKKGIGRLLGLAVIEHAREEGCHLLRLDSPTFLNDSHSLYRALGFQETLPYPGSEIPTEYHDHWIFMELVL
jgi:GNAT superfamily N-acetyltransferase